MPPGRPARDVPWRVGAHPSGSTWTADASPPPRRPRRRSRRRRRCGRSARAPGPGPSAVARNMAGSGLATPDDARVRDELDRDAGPRPHLGDLVARAAGRLDRAVGVAGDGQAEAGGRQAAGRVPGARGSAGTRAPRRPARGAAPPRRRSTWSAGTPTAWRKPRLVVGELLGTDGTGRPRPWPGSGRRRTGPVVGDAGGRQGVGEPVRGRAPTSTPPDVEAHGDDAVEPAARRCIEPVLAGAVRAARKPAPPDGRLVRVGRASRLPVRPIPSPG